MQAPRSGIGRVGGAVSGEKDDVGRFNFCDFTSKPAVARLGQWAARDRFLNGSGVGRGQIKVGLAGARRVGTRRGDRVRRRASMILKALRSALNVSSSGLGALSVRKIRLNCRK